jgi:hypothetical protein
MNKLWCGDGNKSKSFDLMTVITGMKRGLQTGVASKLKFNLATIQTLIFFVLLKVSILHSFN